MGDSGKNVLCGSNRILLKNEDSVNFGYWQELGFGKHEVLARTGM